MALLHDMTLLVAIALAVAVASHDGRVVSRSVGDVSHSVGDVSIGSRIASGRAVASRSVAAPMITSRDSLALLLLGTPRTTSLTISARALRVDGVVIGRERLVVSAAAGRIVVDGVTIDRARIESEDPITVTAAKRRRVLRGVIDLRSRDGNLVVVARTAREQYLATTLCSEASMSDPTDYLVALSVLQRNYLATHRGRHAPDADVCDNTHCQLAAATELPGRAHAVVQQAEDLLLRGRGDSVLPCYYSANCGGSSLTPADVWGRSEPGYAVVRCDECRGDRWRHWTRTVPASPRAREVLAGAPRAPFVDDDFKIRVGRALGFNVVPSNTIDRLERRGSHYVISGRGFGHRVGLCQAGARHLARSGRSAAQILARYFPAAVVSTRTTDQDVSREADRTTSER